MSLPKLLVAVCAIVFLTAVEARTALHEDVAEDMAWQEVRDFGEADSMPLTEEQEFKQNLYYELHPEREPKPEPVKIRFVEEHEGDGAVIATPDSDVVAQTETETETETDSDSEESSAEAEDAPRFAQTESESEAEGESESESELERVASMEDLADEDESAERADARYEMDAALHADLPPVQVHMSPQYENRQPVATVNPARFQQISAAVAANTALFHADRAEVLASQQMWSESQQRALDAAIDAAEAKDAAEEEAETDDEDESNEEDSDESEEQDVSSSPAMIESESAANFHSDRAARQAPANSVEEEEAALRENEQSAAMLEMGGEAMMPTLPGHEHDQFGGDMRFARVHAPLPEDKDSRLYYARSLRGKKIRRMIRRGEMLYRYAPELMSKVFDPARKIDKPGVQPSFAQAMDGPLGPITPPPADGVPKPPAKGSLGPRFSQVHSNTQAGAKAKGDDEEEKEEKEEGGDSSSKSAKGGDAGAKGPNAWIAKKFAAIDQLIKNPIDQRKAYPQMYQHWDNYMFPMRQKPLPPRWYPYPKKGRNPISAFPPAASLFENPPQRGPLQTPNPLFQNPRGSNGLQPIAPPFYQIGSPSAPSPYASPLGYARFPGTGAPTGTDAGANGVLGPRNHPVFSAHPLPLQKWYQKFIQPAEAPSLTKPPASKGGEEGGGDEKEEKEEE